jgi:phospholipid/cholesterol/gamma-HCH transport system substrate-binding protein
VQKRAPTLGNILVIVLFALSCFGLLLFLWESFGGPLPLKPKGYRIVVAFPRSLALAEQSDVRISGVDVGHVVALKLGNDGRTHATLELESQYAPLRSDVHAILRQKTLLGETYVQLIPESHTAPFLPDRGQLADSQVEPSVTLDDILSALDTKTRHAFDVWQQSVAEGIDGRGEDINAAFASLEPFVENANGLVGILASQEGAVTALVHNTGVVFNALAGRDHQLEGLIVNSEHTFQAFAEAFQALPTFEHNSRIALKELDKFATNTSPFLVQFRPAQRQLARLTAQTKTFTPPFNSFLTALGPLTTAAKVGLPDIAKELGLTVPVLENTSPVLHNLDPFLQNLGEYVPEVQALFANVTAASEAHDTNSNNTAGPQEHYLRSMQTITPQGLATYSQRIGTDRGNPYFKPGVFSSLASGLPVFSSSTCANSAPAVSGPANVTVTQGIIEQLIELHVANAPESANAVPAPACLQQSPFTFNGQTSQFPHVTYGGK